MMTQEEYLAEFERELKEELETTRAKTTDYAGKKDAFKNFRLCEDLAGVSTELGIFTRLSDKFSRLGNLLGGKEAQVKDETIQDTLRDIAVYAKILKIYLMSRITEAQIRDWSNSEQLQSEATLAQNGKANADKPKRQSRR